MIWRRSILYYRGTSAARILAGTLLLLTLSGQASAVEITLTAGGDVNLKDADFESITKGVRPFFEGADLGFVNLEAVVSDTQFQRKRGAYVFRTASAGIEHLIGMGVNLFSLANNHAFDFFEPGLERTLSHFEDFQDRFPILATGAGRGLLEAIAPKIISIKGKKILFASIGIRKPAEGNECARDTRMGIACFRDSGFVDSEGNRDQYGPYKRQLALIERMPADYKILSIHSGFETRTQLDKSQRSLYDLAFKSGVNLIIGHHPHVARPIGVRDGGERIALYSLGNLMLRGGSNREGHRNYLIDEREPRYVDFRGKELGFGLLARIVLSDGEGTLKARSIEIIPLKDHHKETRPYGRIEGETRVEIVNLLSLLNGLDKRDLSVFDRDTVLPPEMVTFHPSGKEYGSGIACLNGIVRAAPEDVDCAD